MKKTGSIVAVLGLLMSGSAAVLAKVEEGPVEQVVLKESELRLVEPLSTKSKRIIESIDTEKSRDLTILISQATKESANMRSAMAHCPREQAEVAKRLDKGIKDLVSQLKVEIPKEIYPLFDEIFNKYRKGSAAVYKQKSSSEDRLNYCKKMTENEKGKQATYDLVLQEFRAILAEEKNELNPDKY